MGICAPMKTARRKAVSTKQCIKAKTHSQGGRANGIWLMEPDPRIFWDWILLGLSELGGAETCSGVVPTGGCLQATVGLLQGEDSDPTKTCPGTSPFSKGWWGVGLDPQCNCIMSLGVTLA